MPEKVNLPDAPPIAWPRVKIGDQSLEVKYSFLVTYRMSKLGVDMRKLGSYTETMATHLAVFAECVAHNFRAGDAPTADQWAETLADEADPEMLALQIAQAVQEAFKLGRSKKAKPVTATPAPPEAQ